MKSELLRVTWPLPWWSVVAPAVLIALVTLVTMLEPMQWIYIAPARASGLPSQALLTAGPMAAAFAAWLAIKFVNRRSPMASPALHRVRLLGLRVVLTAAVTWGAAFAVVSSSLFAFWISRSTGGAAYPVELALGVLRFEFFVLSGYAIGVVIARWHGVVWALLWSALWLFVAPMIYTSLLPGRTSNIEYLIFPAISALNHRDLVLGPTLMVVAWWSGVLLAIVLFLYGWFATLSRASRASFACFAALPLSVIAGVALPSLVESPFQDASSTPIVCAPTDAKVEVCVTAEQRPVLPDVAALASPALARIEGHLPVSMETVASTDAVPALVRSGLRPSDVLQVNVSSNGLGDIAFDIGTSLGGLDACGPNDMEGATWAFAVASWLAPTSIYADPPEANPLTSFDDEAVLQWYVENQGDLSRCAYTGVGPE